MLNWYGVSEETLVVDLHELLGLKLLEVNTVRFCQTGIEPQRLRVKKHNCFRQREMSNL